MGRECGITSGYINTKSLTDNNLQVVPQAHDATLATPSDITVGQFARECQVSHLAGRVVRHVLDPTSDRDFQTDEAQQLERTLKAFMPLLIAEQMQFSKYCCSIGICSRYVNV
jgi:hypothetical protein